MFETLVTEVSLLLKLLSISAATAQLQVTLNKKKSAVHHLLLSGGYLAEITDLLDAFEERRELSTFPEENIAVFRKFRDNASHMSRMINQLLDEMGITD